MLVFDTLFNGAPSMTNDGDLSKVRSFCLEPISINSVFDLLRVSLFAISHSLILVNLTKLHTFAAKHKVNIYSEKFF